MTTEALGVIWLQAKECQQPSEAARGKEGVDSPQSLCMEYGPADTLI